MPTYVSPSVRERFSTVKNMWIGIIIYCMSCNSYTLKGDVAIVWDGNIKTTLPNKRHDVSHHHQLGCLFRSLSRLTRKRKQQSQLSLCLWEGIHLNNKWPVMWKPFPNHDDVIKLKTFSALLAICAENSPGNSEFPAQRPVTRSFDVFFFYLRLNKRSSKQ